MFNEKSGNKFRFRTGSRREKKIPGTTRGRNPDWNLILFCVKADRGIINHYSITVVYYKVEQY